MSIDIEPISDGIILAAGRQNRMRGVLDIPKGLVKRNEKALVTMVVEDLGKANINNILLISNSDYYANYQTWKENVAKGNSTIKVIDNGLSSGEPSRGALVDLQHVLSMLNPVNRNAAVLVAPCDTYFEGSILPGFVKFSNNHPNKLITIARDVKNCEVIRKRLGCIEVDEYGKIQSFVEKPDEPSSCLASVPFYIVPRRLWQKLNEYLEAGKNPDAPGMWIPWLLQKKEEVYAYVIDSDTMDVGTPEDVKRMTDKQNN